MIDAFYFFSYFSGLKPNLTKSEIAGIGVLKEVQETVCGMRCIDLNIETYSFLLKLKIKEGEKKLWDCNRYSTSIKKMENEKPYTRRLLFFKQ